MTDADKRYQGRMMVKEKGGIMNTLKSREDHSIYSALVVASEMDFGTKDSLLVGEAYTIPYINYTLPFDNLYEFLNSAWASQLTTNAWQAFNGAVNFVYWGLIDGLIDFAQELGL